MNLLNHIWKKIKDSLRLFPLIGIQGTSKSGPNIYEQVRLSSTGQAALLTKHFSLSQRECLSDCFLLFNWPQVYGTELHIILVYDAPLALSSKDPLPLASLTSSLFYSQLINRVHSHPTRKLDTEDCLPPSSSRNSPSQGDRLHKSCVCPIFAFHFITSKCNPPKYFKFESFLTLERVIHTVIF